MPQYAGNLVGQVGPDNTIYTGVAANYRRAFAPFSNFGTRQIAFLVVSLTGANINSATVDASVSTADTTNVGGTGEQYAISDASGNVVIPATNVYASNSHVYAALNGVAIAAEIAMVGQPVFSGSGNSKNVTLTVGIFIDTAASANADMQHAALANTNAQTIQTAVTNAVGALGTGAAVSVQPAYLSGNTLAIPGAAY